MKASVDYNKMRDGRSRLPNTHYLPHYLDDLVDLTPQPAGLEASMEQLVPLRIKRKGTLPVRTGTIVAREELDQMLDEI
jgi:hypothetical protein